jgi:hypothetical protein
LLHEGEGVDLVVAHSGYQLDEAEHDLLTALVPDGHPDGRCLLRRHGVKVIARISRKSALDGQQQLIGGFPVVPDACPELVTT